MCPKSVHKKVLPTSRATPEILFFLLLGEPRDESAGALYPLYYGGVWYVLAGVSAPRAVRTVTGHTPLRGCAAVPLYGWPCRAKWQESLRGGFLSGSFALPDVFLTEINRHPKDPYFRQTGRAGPPNKDPGRQAGPG